RDEIARASWRTEDADTFESTVRQATRIRREQDADTLRVPGKKRHVQPAIDGGLEVSEHLDGVILVVADGEKAFRPQQTFRIGVRIEVGDVTHIVAARLHPVGEREFPEEPFAGTGGERGIHDLAVLPIRTVEADLNVRPPIPLSLAVVVERELARPAIVSLPGRVRALEDEISRAIVPDDEDDV